MTAFEVYIVRVDASSAPHMTTVHRKDCGYMRGTKRLLVSLPEADTVEAALAINGPTDAHLCRNCFRSTP